MTRPHAIEDLSFADGWLRCVCGATMEPDPETYSAHVGGRPVRVADTCPRGHVGQFTHGSRNERVCVPCRNESARLYRLAHSSGRPPGRPRKVQAVA
jgi:hypothetical protein